MVISILLACGALAASAPTAALGAGLPLPVSAGQVQQQIAQVQHSAPAVPVPPAAQQVARDAVPAAAAPAAEQVRERVREVVAPATGAVPAKPAASHPQPAQAGSRAAATPSVRQHRATGAAKRTRAAHTGGKRAHQAIPSPAQPKAAQDALAQHSSHASAARPAPSHGGTPPAPELPGISAAAAAGIALAGGLLAVLLTGFGAWTVRRPLNGFLCLPPSAALCSAIERPG